MNDGAIMEGIGGGATVMPELKELLRSSLRVGPEIALEDDMPLIGGPIDLDSIDILLVVSNIEKHFGMKIPSEALGRAAFESVRTLAKYVEDNRTTLAVKRVSSVAGSVLPAGVDYLARLPHGAEFRFLTAVKEVEEGRGAMGVWVVKGDEGFLAGHFPGRPVVPGVLVTEAMAQLAGIAAAGVGEVGVAAMLAHVDVRFLAPAVPPTAIELRATVVGSGAEGAAMRTCEVMASVGGMAIAKGTVTLHFSKQGWVR